MPSLEDLKCAIERIKRISRQLQEGGVETSIVLPILSALGWDTANHLETRSKYSFTLRTRREVDIALFSKHKPNEPAIFFEVKRTSSTLKEKDKDQLLEYCRLKSVQLGILTNGFTWEFYSEANSASTMTSAKTVKIRDAATDEAAKTLRKILERKTVINGTAHGRLKKMADEKAQQERQKASLREIWKEFPRDESKQKQLAGFLRKVANVELGENIPKFVAEEFVAEELKSLRNSRRAYKPVAVAKQKAGSLLSPNQKQGRTMTLIVFRKRFVVQTGREAMAKALYEIYQRSPDDLEMLAKKLPKIIKKSSVRPSSLRVPKQVGELGFWFEGHRGIPAFKRMLKRICRILGVAEDAIRVQNEK